MNVSLSEHPKLEEAWLLALKTRENAHAPYSKFEVGAAIYLENADTLVSGCNVENASYGASICAERGAVLAACARYGKPSIGFILITTDEPKGTLPCAACLQVLAEFCKAETPVYSGNTEGLKSKWRFNDLLPHPFVNFEIS